MALARRHTSISREGESVGVAAVWTPPVTRCSPVVFIIVLIRRREPSRPLVVVDDPRNSRFRFLLRRVSVHRILQHPPLGESGIRQCLSLIVGDRWKCRPSALWVATGPFRSPEAQGPSEDFVQKSLEKTKVRSIGSVTQGAAYPQHGWGPDHHGTFQWS